MKKYFKLLFILPFVLCLLILDFDYINSLNLPDIIPSNYIVVAFLIISYILKIISIFKMYSIFDIKDTNEYNKYLYVNIIFNIFTMICLSNIKSLFLAFSSITICLLSNLFLYYETKSYDKKIAKYLIFSVYFSLICSFFTLITYFMNL